VQVDCCIRSLSQGVSATHIIDGRQPHSLLMELLTDEGVGTMVGAASSHVSVMISFVELVCCIVRALTYVRHGSAAPRVSPLPSKAGLPAVCTSHLLLQTCSLTASLIVRAPADYWLRQSLKSLGGRSGALRHVPSGMPAAHGVLSIVPLRVGRPLSSFSCWGTTLYHCVYSCMLCPFVLLPP